jgi:hypothetical protein
VVHNRKEITWIACWAHARRKHIEMYQTTIILTDR